MKDLTTNRSHSKIDSSLYSQPEGYGCGRRECCCDGEVEFLSRELTGNSHDTLTHRSNLLKSIAQTHAMCSDPQSIPHHSSPKG